MINRVAVILSCTFLAMVFSGCSDHHSSPEGSDMMDEMYKTDAYGEEIYIFSFNDSIYTVDEIYDISRGMSEPVEDGRFCLMAADVTYLNGGVAGYVNYPEVKNVIELKDVSPLEINLPEISSARGGLSLIKDYAEGDVLLDSYSDRAVWKDGNPCIICPGKSSAAPVCQL